MKNIFLFLLVITSYGVSRAQSGGLSDEDKSLAAQIGFDEWVLAKIKKQYPDVVFSRMKQYIWDENYDLTDSTLVNGVTFYLNHSQADTLIYDSGEILWEKGYLVFRSYDAFVSNPNQVSILKTPDQFEALRIMGTAGYFHAIKVQDVINFSRSLHKRFPFRITLAQINTFEAVITGADIDWEALAAEIFKINPGVFDGTPNQIKNRAEEMKKENLLFMWWN